MENKRKNNSLHKLSKNQFAFMVGRWWEMRWNANLKIDSSLKISLFWILTYLVSCLAKNTSSYLGFIYGWPLAISCHHSLRNSFGFPLSNNFLRLTPVGINDFHQFEQIIIMIGQKELKTPKFLNLVFY